MSHGAVGVYGAHRPLKAVAPVQIRSGLLMKQQVKGLIAGPGGRAHDHLSVVRP
jgi:hypothetical protein